MADNEGKSPDRWKETKKALGDKLCRWDKGCLEEEVIACLDDNQIEEFIRDPEEQVTGFRLRTLADRLDLADKSFKVIAEKAGLGLRTLMVEACCGAVPAAKKDSDKSVKRSFRAHAQTWFKSEAGGRGVGREGHHAKAVAETGRTTVALPQCRSRGRRAAGR